MEIPRAGFGLGCGCFLAPGIPRRSTRRMLDIRRCTDPAIRQTFAFVASASWAEHSLGTATVGPRHRCRSWRGSFRCDDKRVNNSQSTKASSAKGDRCCGGITRGEENKPNPRQAYSAETHDERLSLVPDRAGRL